MAESKKVSGINVSEAAVKKATGREWKEWLTILDKAGGKKMSHKELASLLEEEHNVRPWWTQMVAVQYELSRGLRGKHQTPGGYQISRSKTINVPADILYKAFEKPAARMKWLKDPDIKITTAHKNKIIRGKWMKETIAIDISLDEKSAGKTQVVVQNNRIKTSAQAEKLKSYWEKALLKLSEIAVK